MDLTLTAHTATTDFALPAPGDIPDTFPPGRRCVHEDDHGHQCITRLNRFHPGSLCYQHEARHEAQLLREIAKAEADRDARNSLMAVLAAKGMRQQEIAQRFGVHRETVRKIVNRITIHCGECGQVAEPSCVETDCPFNQ
jgi:predicted DNA-binding protein (UPF0251 family)